MKKVLTILIIIMLLCGCGKPNYSWKNIAHRGQAKRVHENTIPALLEAKKEGFNGAEIDVRRTKDGMIVLNHDKKVTGMVNGEFKSYKIANTKLSKLSKLVLMKDYEYGGIHLSTLDEMLDVAYINSMELVIHYKIQDPDFLIEVAQKVVDHKMSGNCIYNVNSDYEVNIPIVLSVDKNARFQVYYSDEAMNLMEKNFKYLNKDQIVMTVKTDILNRKVTRRIKKAGFTYYIWFVNDKTIKQTIVADPEYIEYMDRENYAMVYRRFPLAYKFNK